MTGGFRWKEKAKDDDLHDKEMDRGLERGYRGRDHAQDRDRQRSPVRDKVDKGTVQDSKAEKAKTENKASKPAPVGEPMIIVNVNDRLGTKASIPCLASDPISGLTSLLLFPDLLIVIQSCSRLRLQRQLDANLTRLC